MLKKLTNRLLGTAAPGILWDTVTRGFGVKILASGRHVFVLQYRFEGVTKRHTIGTWPQPWPLQDARREAGRLLQLASQGQLHRQLPEEPTLGEVLDRYLSEHVAVFNKPSMRRQVERLVRLKIRPLLGSKKVGALTRADIKAWHARFRDTPYEANRALAALSKALSLAAFDWELRPDNPARGLRRFPEQARDAYLRGDELARLGAVLDDSSAGRAIKLLLLTGCRAGEILAAEWGHLEGHVLWLPDAKAGARPVVLSSAALAVLEKAGQRSGLICEGPTTASSTRRGAGSGGWLGST